MRIGIDLDGTKTEGIVMDAERNIVHHLRCSTPQELGYEAALNSAARIDHPARGSGWHTLQYWHWRPGSLSPDTACIRNSNTICINGQPFQADLQTRLNREISIANDASCFGLSETIEGDQHIAGEWGHNPLGNEGRP